MRARNLLRSWVRKAWSSRRPKKYHFIHIPKNGGMSVRHALELRGDVSLSEPYHYRYVDIADQVGRHLDFFCIVRNPWSRTASRYRFAKQDSMNWPASDPRRLYISQTTFDSFVKERKVLPIPRHPERPWMGPLGSWFNQLEWIRDESGRVACACLRLEHLEEDVAAYFGRPVEVARRNATKERYDYRAMYTDDLAEIVADVFREDIEHFGFSFDGPATRNVAVLS